MALRDSIYIFGTTGAIEQSGSLDQRAWVKENDLLENDYYLETVLVEVIQWPACTLLACQTALVDVEAIEATESAGESTTMSGRYWIESRKTSPKGYTFEMTTENRLRYKNGVLLTDPE